jgi:hypothetical protein
MKKRKFKVPKRNGRFYDLSAEVSSVLARNNARSALIVAYVFTVSMAGLGLILSYLLLNVIEYCSVEITDFWGFFAMLVSVYLFAAPAFTSVRNTASAICDGREVTLPEIFTVFTSFKSWSLSYLPIRFFSWVPKYNKGQGKSYCLLLRAAIKARMRLINILRFDLDVLLSFVTCFIYFFLVAGPRSAVRRELILRKINYINLKNNERTVKRND